MRHRCLASIGMLAAAVLIVSPLAVVPVLAQASSASSAAAGASSRTAWGDPDLQGVYTFSTPTPLERPRELAGKAVLTEAELAEQEELNEAWAQNEARAVPEAGSPGTYNAFWTSNEKGRPTGRTSLIVNPENGRRPPLTPEAEKRRTEETARTADRRVGTPPNVYVLYDSWTDLPHFTRCLARPFPRIGQSYNHGIQILQSPGYVVLHYESMHDVRIIPVDDRPHIPGNVRQWNGDSRGRWEGDTLVVDSTNFADQEFAGASQLTMRFTERFTKVDANTIKYEVTVEDPTTWTQPWTFELPWRSDDPNYEYPEHLYEFACHEGNYKQVENALKGTRHIREQYGRQVSGK